MTAPRTPIACPDCSAVSDAVEGLSHDQGCPAAVAIDAMTDRDIGFFLSHPGVRSYLRELLPGDLGISSLDAVSWSGRVEVSRLDCGCRLRVLPARMSVALVHPDGRESATGKFLGAVAGQTEPMPRELRRELGEHGWGAA